MEPFRLFLREFQLLTGLLDDQFLNGDVQRREFFDGPELRLGLGDIGLFERRGGWRAGRRGWCRPRVVSARGPPPVGPSCPAAPASSVVPAHPGRIALPEPLRCRAPPRPSQHIVSRRVSLKSCPIPPSRER